MPFRDCNGNIVERMGKFVCPFCKNGEVVVTNEEYIRSCSTEELADVIAERIINSHTMFEYILHQDNRRKEDLVREIREWLKEKKE